MNARVVTKIQLVESRTSVEQGCRVASPRLPLAESTPAMQALLARGANPELVGVVGHAGDMFIDWFKLFGRLVHDGATPGHVKEAARLRVAALNECHLCMHVRAKGSDGQQLLAEELCEAAQLGDVVNAGFTDTQRVAIQFAEQMFTDPDGLPDEMLAHIRTLLTDQQLMELGLAIAEFIGMGKLFKTFGLAATFAVEAPAEMGTHA
jgi:alkylhydroperoxidase family enzyme